MPNSPDGAIGAPARPGHPRIADRGGVLFVLAVVYFAFALKKDPITAALFRDTTMTTTGYGDITPATHLGMLATMVLEVLGVAFSGISIAFVTTALTRAQFTALQGCGRFARAGTSSSAVRATSVRA